MSNLRISERPAAAELCLACGLCCNGVIFADVKLQPGDDATRLVSLGLKLRTPKGNRAAPKSGGELKGKGRTRRFHQPCAAFEDGHCRIYAERPTYCREFECVLLKSATAGRTEWTEAFRMAREARQRADKVGRLLRLLGETDESLPLSARFRRVSRRLQRAPLEDSTADLFAELTLAVHDLNLLISQTFYPGCRRRTG